MKRINATIGSLLILLMTSFTGRSFAQYDTIAVAILDSMSYNIGNLESCSFSFDSEFDIPSEEYGLITHSESGFTVLKAPGKMYVEKKGDKGHKEFFSDGKSFSLYSHDKNQYATMQSTMNLIDFIDSISGYYGIEFPGTDVFYPDFVDNILETSDNLVFLGLGMIANTECYHIAGVRDDMTFQIWISSDDKYLPMKLSIVYTTRSGNPQYRIVYSDWKLNEYIDDSRFTFIVPDGAKLTKLTKGSN
jgi:hypothetical protein